MNSAVITKIEYRIFPNANFSNLEIIPQSGKLSSPRKKDAGGNAYFETSVPFNMAKSEPVKDDMLKNIVSRKGQFRITDANGFVYLVGNESYPARLNYGKALQGTPGSFNGYQCVITCKSVTGCEISQ